ncbi:MAG: RluA family pseudouridine synthase [Pseudomonadota bacterium]
MDKPAGMPSVSLKSGEKDTLAAWIIGRFPGQAEIGREDLEGGLVHRLDNDTSGIMVAAKSQAAYEDLRRQFDEGSVRKEYQALAIGSPPERGLIDTPIAHHPRKKKKMVACTSPEEAEKWKGRPAHTEFEVIRRFKILRGPTPPGEIFALLSVTIATGVRHQIRVHLSSIGFPIAGDRLYQKKKGTFLIFPFSRQLLHASGIEFLHPATARLIKLSSPLPADFKDAISTLKPR